MRGTVRRANRGRGRAILSVASVASVVSTLLAVSFAPNVAGAAGTAGSEPPDGVGTAAAPSITIVHDSIPDAEQDFTYTGCAGASCTEFVLDDDSGAPPRGSTVTGSGLAPGTYTISQAAVAGWALVDIACDTDESIDLASRTVTITLSAGEAVTCTFIDRAPAIRIVQDAIPGSPHDFGFTGCLGSGCSTFSLDDDADATLPDSVVGAPLAPGTYTITQSADATWPLTGITCTTAEAVDVANRRVTITLSPNEFTTCTFANKTQSITVVQNTEPDAAEDFAFTGCLGAGCSTFSLDDDADGTLPNTVTGAELATGTYTITQGPEAGYDLTGLSCTTNESVNFTTRTVTIGLSPGENVTCTFTDTIGGPTIPITQMGSGHRQTCAVVQGGTARCWGAGGGAALGNGTTADRTLPTVVTNEDGSGPLTGITEIHTSGSALQAPPSPSSGRTCARLEDGTARCWGSSGGVPGGIGSLGDAAGSTSSLRPVPVANPSGTGPLLGVAQIGTGATYSCARVGNQVRCWGRGGALGDDSFADRALPVTVVDVDGAGPLTQVTQISVGGSHACALLASGEVRCWGGNERGQLGDGTYTARSRAVVVVNPEMTGPLTDVVEVSAGNGLTCARLANGQARCWGGNTGNGLSGSNRPVTVLDPTGTAPLTGVADVSVGGTYAPVPGLGDSPYRAACAVLTSGQLRCWGMNQFRQLGDGTTTTRLLPITVLNADGTGPLTDVAQVTMGGQGACAILTTGEGRCWGTVAPGNGSGASVFPARVLIH